MSELILYAKKNGQLNGQTDRWTAGRTDGLSHYWTHVAHSAAQLSPLCTNGRKMANKNLWVQPKRITSIYSRRETTSLNRKIIKYTDRPTDCYWCEDVRRLPAKEKLKLLYKDTLQMKANISKENFYMVAIRNLKRYFCRFNLEFCEIKCTVKVP